MFVPLWILIPAALLLLIFLVRALRGGGDMIERQRRATLAPSTEQSAALAQPDIRDAIASGRKIEAIRLVRERTGLGLKESKQLVESQTAL